jgi:hypothetical protein
MISTEKRSSRTVSTCLFCKELVYDNSFASKVSIKDMLRKQQFFLNKNTISKTAYRFFFCCFGKSFSNHSVQTLTYILWLWLRNQFFDYDQFHELSSWSWSRSMTTPAKIPNRIRLRSRAILIVNMKITHHINYGALHYFSLLRYKVLKRFWRGLPKVYFKRASLYILWNTFMTGTKKQY